MNFSQLIAILRGRARLIISIVAVSLLLGAAVTYILPKRYTAIVALVLDFTEPMSALLPQALLSNSYIATQVDIVRSPRVARKVVNALKLTQDLVLRQQYEEETRGEGTFEDWLASLLLRNMDVVPTRESRVINILFHAPDANLAAVIGNAFAQAYIDTNLELSVEPAKQNAEWIDRQLMDLRAKVEAAQGKLSAYQQSHGIVGTDERLDIETERLNALSRELSTAQVGAQDAENKLKQLREAAASANRFDSVPEILANSFIQSIKSELLRLEAKLQEATQSLGRNHPEYRQIVNDVASLRNKLDAEMDKVISAARTDAALMLSRRDELVKAVDAQKTKVLNIMQRGDELPALMREAEAAQRAYDAGLERSNQQTLQSRLNQTNIAVLNPAVAPLHPSRPRVGLNMGLALFFGLFLGVNAAVLTELRRRRVRLIDDITERSTIPVLGTLPWAQAAPRKSNVSTAVQENQTSGDMLPLGKILVNAGRLDAESTDRVLDYQRTRQVRFGQAALKLKLISEDDLEQALARQFNYRYLRPGEGDLSLELIAAYRPFSAPAEALRSLRSQVWARWFSVGEKALALVSPGHGDGRSYLVANLAIAFVQRGERVLILDADLRAPRQHEIFGLQNQEGLSTYLSERTAQAPLIEISAFPGLVVAPSGPEPPNPHELLSRKRMRDMLDSARENFDIIFVDTPAFSSAADARELCQLTRGALLLARQNSTLLGELGNVERDLNAASIQCIGYVVNCGV